MGSIGNFRAAAGCALITAAIGTLGCSDQYADYGKIDVAASKAAAEKSGLKKFTPQRPKGASARKASVSTEKPSAPPSRGTIPQ